MAGTTFVPFRVGVLFCIVNNIFETDCVKLDLRCRDTQSSQLQTL